MANSDVITRLKMETTQYDSKLRDAAQKLKEFGREADKAGADFQKLSKENMELAKSFGTIGTSATNNKDKLKELVNAYNDVAKAYNNLTKEQQQSDIGKVLGQSLDQLKGRIADTKTELQNVGTTIKDTSKSGDGLGNILDKVAGKFGLNVSQLGKFGIAMGATTAALKVARDAFFASEENLDNWNRTVYSAQSTYEAFLTALNTGDISGFLNNMSRIVNAAKAAYDAIDWLNTQAAINNPKVKAQMAENARFDKMLQTGTYIAPAKGSGLTPTMAEGTKLTPAQLKALERQRANGQRTLMRYKNIELDALNNTIGSLYEEQAARLGMSRGQFMAGVADSDTFKKNLDMYSKYKAFEKAHTTTQRVETGYLGGQTRLKTVRDNVANPYAAYKGWGVFKDDGELFKTINGYIDQRANLQSSIYSDYGQMYRTFNRADARIGRMTGGGGGGRGGHGGGGGTPTYVPVAGSIDAQAALVAQLQKQWRAAADDDSRTKIKEQLDAANKELDVMQGKIEAPVGSMKYYQQQLTELQQKQQEVTTNNEWEYYAGQIDFVNKKMKELRGEVEQLATGTSGATGAAIGDWISAQQQSLANMELGAGASQVYANIIDAKTLENLLNYALENDISISPDSVESLWDQIIDGDNIPDSVWENLEETINSMLAEMDLDPINIDVNTGSISKGAKVVEEGWKDAAAAVQSVGNALQQIEDPGAKIAGIVGEAIANIALGFAQATASDSKLGVFGWIAAIAGGLGTMLGTISAIKSATAGSYAEGGIIPGNNHNDGLIAAVSSGELILNRAQQNSIAGQLTSNQGNGESRPYVDVETIWLGMGHYLKRKGMGEIVTTR